MSYEVFINNRPSGSVIVNCANEESAKKTWLHHYPGDKGKISLKPIIANMPPMFKNCVFNKYQVIPQNSNN